MPLWVPIVSSPDEEGLSSEGQPKYITVSYRLAARIQSGEWADGRVPTVREIAAQYSVSSFTASRALHLLQEKGLIVTKERSGCFVSPAAMHPAERWGVVLSAPPGGETSYVETSLRAALGEIASSEGVQLLEIPAPDSGALLTDAAPGTLRGYLVLPSASPESHAEWEEPFLLRCRSQGRPVVFLDTLSPSGSCRCEYDVATADHFESGRTAAAHLLELGRRSIAYAVKSSSGARTDRLGGFLVELRNARDSGRWGGSPIVLRPPNHNLTGNSRWLAEQVTERRIDAVLCEDHASAAAILTELGNRGIKTPEDVAIVGGHDSSITSNITGMTYPAAEILRWGIRLLRNRLARPSDPPSRILVRGQLVIRSSTV